MIHVTTTTNESCLFEENEMIQAHRFSFAQGEYVEKKRADEIKPGEWIRWRGLREAVRVLRVRQIIMEKQAKAAQ